MRQHRTTTIDDVTYTYYVKSIKIESPHGTEFVYYNRKPTGEDVQVLHRIIRLGVRQQLQLNQDTWRMLKVGLGLDK
jgi:hypothetical protein